jgi:type II secretory pathway pseudopilin PulG
MNKKALTLIELILALILISGTLAVVSGGLLFFVNQLQANIERNSMHSQLNYAMEDMKLRCVSALNLSQYFPAAGGDKNEITFEGECNIYEVTLNDDDDNCIYRYYKDANNNLILNCADAGGTCTFGNELLVEGKYNPTLNFTFDNTLGLNVLTVDMTATSTSPHRIPLGGNATITKTGGIRFWFIDVTQ